MDMQVIREIREPNAMCSTLQIEHSRYDSWPRSLRCVLGQDTSLSQYIFPYRCITGQGWGKGVGRGW